MKAVRRVGAERLAEAGLWRWALAVVVCCLVASGCALRLGPGPNPNLRRAATVFVDSPRYFEFLTERQKRLEQFLKEALVGRGFEVAASALGSGAVLRIEESTIITLDGPAPDPPRYVFDAELTATGLALWKTSFEIASRDEEAAIQRRAMQRVADRLFEAWKESEVRAGRLTRGEARTLKRISSPGRTRQESHQRPPNQPLQPTSGAETEVE